VFKGSARSVFSTQEEFLKFENSKQCRQISGMVQTLRGRKLTSDEKETTRVITVSLPESLHLALKSEASDHNTSMSKLFIAKLLQIVAEEEPTIATPTPQTATPTS